MLREALIKETNEKIEAMLQKEYVKCTEYEKKLKCSIFIIQILTSSAKGR